MCAPASMVLTKDRVCWSKTTDSHEEIIREFELHADGSRGPNIARVEITPPNGDFTKPLSEWCYKLDQDGLPPWYDRAECEARTREALSEWLAAKVVLPGIYREIREGHVWVYGRVTAYGSSQVKACGSSQVTACDSSQVTACDSSQVKAYGSSQVRACGSSQVKAYGSSVVTAYHKIDAAAITDQAVLLDRTDYYATPKVYVGGIEFVAKPKRARKVKTE